MRGKIKKIDVKVKIHCHFRNWYFLAVTQFVMTILEAIIDCRKPNANICIIPLHIILDIHVMLTFCIAWSYLRLYYVCYLLGVWMLFWLPYRFLLLYPTIYLSIWTVVNQEYRNNLKQFKLVEHTRYLTEYKLLFFFSKWIRHHNFLW